ncbi:GNAT family N-acetyltransferase [Tsukamurella sp. 1534]|uniref:GNAT family N-acetyltransferase n=1 Tax=Tsukamurella sp. 1534 TaxID=1151061 RepID=UPI0002DD0B3F|nr:GNAT family N-acetyltransferase [Tsukamurella sp. 1534]
MITFRRVAREDFGLLAIWLSEPHNRRWWNHEVSPEAIELDFGRAVDGAEPSEDWLALDGDGAPFGLVQRQRWVDYPEEAAGLAPLVVAGPGDWGIDYLVGSHFATGRGLGSAMIAAMCEVIFADLGADSVIVAVAAGNRRSWRALERAGFSRLGHVDIPADNPADPPDHLVYALPRPA